jgi:hypothetical protein
MFLLIWLLLGVVTITTLAFFRSFRAANIKNTILRRAVIVAVVLAGYPAFVSLSAIDNFLQAVDFDGTNRSAMDYLEAFLKEITFGLYEEAKGAW